MQLLNVNEPDFDKIKTMIYIPKRIETYSWEKENGTFHLSTTYCHVRDKEEFEEIGLNLKA